MDFSCHRCLKWYPVSDLHSRQISKPTPGQSISRRRNVPNTMKSLQRNANYFFHQFQYPQLRSDISRTLYRTTSILFVFHWCDVRCTRAAFSIEPLFIGTNSQQDATSKMKSKLVQCQSLSSTYMPEIVSLAL